MPYRAAFPAGELNVSKENTGNRMKSPVGTLFLYRIQGMNCRFSRIIKPLIFLIPFISVLLLHSCTKAPEEVGTLKTGIYKIELSPSYATKNSSITAKVRGAGPSDLSYQWIINGSEIEGAIEKVLQYPYLKKNDSVQVKVFIKDKGELVSDPLIISNIIPEIQTAKLLPQNPKKGDKLKVEVKTFDGDNDLVSLSYEWFVNGESVDETFDVIAIKKPIKRGDKVSVKITPDDGEQEGQAITLYSVVANALPNVLSDMEPTIDDFVYTSKVMAKDPEGDPLTFSLKQAPDGMIINSKSGVITWELELEDEGAHNIIVSVIDSHGGGVLVPYTITINFEFPE